MISVIDDLGDGVIGFEATGRVTAEDYESVLMPAVEGALDAGAKARLLLVFGAEFEGYEADAALDDMKMGAHTWGDFERVAFVTDHTTYRGFVKTLGFLMPGQVKVYELSQLDEARTWVSE